MSTNKIDKAHAMHMTAIATAYAEKELYEQKILEKESVIKKIETIKYQEY